jgi:4-amino-4-deoxy-L-arabinose transferase-like glycosyltransferase
MIGFSHAAATDMPFSSMLTIAMVCAAFVLRLVPAQEGRANPAPTNRATPWFPLILFGVFLGLAVLAKGPAAIILSGGAIFFWAIFTKRWRDAFRLLHPAAIAAFCLTALPWYILCARRNPDFFRIFIIEHNFKRFLTPEFQHIQPFWFYIPVLVLALFPWSISSATLLRNAAHALQLANRPKPPGLFLVCWGLFPIVFFSFSKSKLPGYVLPAILPLVALIAESVSQRTLKILPGDRWIKISSGLTFITLGILGVLQVERTPMHWPALVFAVGGFAILVLRELRHGLAVGVCTLIVAVALALTGNTSKVLDQRYSARDAPLSARIVWSDYSPEQSSTYKLTRSFQYALNFYFHRELPEWSPDQAARGWVFTLANEESELRSRGLSCPFNALRHAVIVCEVPGLPARPAGSGQPK